MNSDSPVVGQVAPTDDALAVEEEYGWAGNVAAFHGVAELVPEVVGIGCHEISIGEDGEVEFELLNDATVFFHGIDADSKYPTAVIAYFLDAGLQTLQFGETERSPMATIEDQDYFAAEKVG